MSWSNHLPGVRKQLFSGLPPETPAEKTARIEAAAAYRRRQTVQNYYTPTPQEVRERLVRRSRRAKREIADDRYRTKVKYDLDELNLTALHAPHVEQEMKLSSKGGRRKTRKQRHLTRKLSLTGRLRASLGRERKRA